MRRTDWDQYYSAPVPTAFLSRAVVRHRLLRLIRETGSAPERSIAELGGGGSCFCEAIRNRFNTKEYTAYDSSKLGLQKFLRKNPDCRTVMTDLLSWNPETQYDLVFSVGLIEHFQESDTEIMIRKHFEMTKPGGYVIILVPTPTLLYRITRKIAESGRLWKFPDERPVSAAELKKTADTCGICLNSFTIYANFLSQYAVLYRKI